MLWDVVHLFQCSPDTKPWLLKWQDFNPLGPGHQLPWATCRIPLARIFCLMNPHIYIYIIIHIICHIWQNDHIRHHYAVYCIFTYNCIRFYGFTLHTFPTGSNAQSELVRGRKQETSHAGCCGATDTEPLMAAWTLLTRVTMEGKCRPMVPAFSTLKTLLLVASWY